MPGRDEVATIATGVSAHLELFELAAAEKADLLLVHHGIFWGSGPGPIDAPLKRRLRVLFEADISLAAYHLPLDAHLEVGNNALLARALGAEQIGPVRAASRAADRRARRARQATIPASELFAAHARGDLARAARVRRGPRTACAAWRSSPAPAPTISARRRRRAPTPSSPASRPSAAWRRRASSALHFIAAGHYATETFGVRRLGEQLAETFALRHLFLDVPNPV